jgi:hypothetical protein
MTAPHMWPTIDTFHNNWPLLVVDLVVATWKIEGAESLSERAAIDVELLDPPPAPERDWRATYAAELARHPLILEDLERGGRIDGTELVLERAGLTLSERTVIRGFLMGDDAKAIAQDLRWRPQTVGLILSNARHRLADPRWAQPKQRAAAS